MKRTIFAIAALFAVGLPDTPANAQSGADALMASSDVERRAVLHRAVTDLGSSCTGVSYAARAGQNADRTFWDVRCSNGTMYRIAVSASSARAIVTPCGAEAPAPMAGPCFRPVQRATLLGGVQVASTSNALAASIFGRPPTWNPMVGAAERETTCRSTCEPRTSDRVSACLSICLQGGDPDGPPVGSVASADFGRFGAAYLTGEPSASWGFANGRADRMAVNLQAVTACQAMAGREPCLFQAEFVNRCGAIARASKRHPMAVIETSDASTTLVLAVAIGDGETREAAEASAMTACGAKVGTTTDPRAASRPICRVVASGC